MAPPMVQLYHNRNVNKNSLLFKVDYTSDGVYDPNLVDKQPGIYLLIVSLDEEASDEKE